MGVSVGWRSPFAGNQGQIERDYHLGKDWVIKPSQPEGSAPVDSPTTALICNAFITIG